MISGIGQMTCKETIRLICEYLEGKLSPPVALALHRHLEKCQNCLLIHDAARLTLHNYFEEDSELPPANSGVHSHVHA
jgi:hypothetical protein